MNKIERLKKQLEEAQKQQEEQLKQEEIVVQSYNKIFLKCISDFNQIKTLEIKQAIRRIAKNIAREFGILSEHDMVLMEKDFNGYAKNTYNQLKEGNKSEEVKKEDNE